MNKILRRVPLALCFQMGSTDATWVFSRYDIYDKAFPQSSLSVLVGVHDLNANLTTEPSQRRHSVERIIIHDNYTHGQHAYDIMLFQVSPRIQYSDERSPICVDKSVFPATKTCIVTGFGSTVSVGKELLQL